MKFQENIIGFVFNDRISLIDFSKNPDLKPTTTVLNYLRGLNEFKGVKEGCAEGDCGACTVVIGELENGKIKYRAVDSCLLFLPMIHGKQLITVENLSRKGCDLNELHPVQKLMAENYGSQCGYCTPGFVMSLFALYKNHSNPSRKTVLDYLTGNLCRCTGYQPIIESAMKLSNHDRYDSFTKKQPYITELLNQLKQATETIEIITQKQKYFRPVSLQDALELRKDFKNAIIICGSTDIALRQTKKNELLEEILDLSGIDELKFFSEDNDNYIIGAGLPLEDLRLASENRINELSNLLNVFGSMQIRNLATLGGNAGTASPIGDTLPFLFASDAKIVLRSIDEEREIPVRKFIKGYRKTNINTNEIITSIKIPKNINDVLLKFYKVSKRKDLDISTVSAAFRLKTDKDRKILEIIIAFGGVAEYTKRALKTEEFLLNKKWDRKNVENAMKILYDEFTPISDARSGAEFRRVAAKNLLLKFYTETI